MTVGERLRYLRKELLTLSCEKFAEPLGVKKALISAIERGEVQLTPRLANAICDHYRVDYFWLTEGADMPVFIQNVPIIKELGNTYNLTEDEERLVKYYCDHPDFRKSVSCMIDDLNKKG